MAVLWFPPLVLESCVGAHQPYIFCTLDSNFTWNQPDIFLRFRARTDYRLFFFALCIHIFQRFFLSTWTLDTLPRRTCNQPEFFPRFTARSDDRLFFLALVVHIFPRFFSVHVISDLDDVTEIRKLTANVEAVLLGVLIPLCQRNSGRLDEADREVLCHFLIILF